jgi:hypothetical protein
MTTKARTRSHRDGGGRGGSFLPAISAICAAVTELGFSSMRAFYHT